AVTLRQEVVERARLSVEGGTDGLVADNEFGRSTVTDAATRIGDASSLALDPHLRGEIGEVEEGPRRGHGKGTLGIKAEKVHARLTADRHVGPDVQLREF